MFKQKPNSQSDLINKSQSTSPQKRNWLKISVIANIAVVVIAVIGTLGAYTVHESNTNPKFCGQCHIMAANVNSYLTSTNLDHVHEQAGVQCKDCHDYPLSAEISSGVKFITGNYSVDAKGELTQRIFDDSMCTKCHISEAHVATLTDFLAKNPHDSHNGELPCNTCHVSHGQQIDFCSQCHDNGGQRMIGAPVKERGTISDANGS
jgi:nitrate/TMAO reductase-like tetraheme cytochrome c subunit